MSPKKEDLLRLKRKRPPRLKRKDQRSKGSGGPAGDGVLFPGTRVPRGMNKKTAKKLKKATRHKL
ncbi:MAG: hypothetical protein ACXADY_11005 [Candidatus Hodarchaeales archaeon]|jgi:hypothetical protein